jgi:hypothetical protein
VLDGRPLALAHLPRRSWWPFVMSVGFTILFVSALVEILWLALLGLAVTFVAIVGWFWPVDTETEAIAELYSPALEGPRGGWLTAPTDAPAPVGEDPEGVLPPTTVRMPLAVGDRSANGYWGTGVLVVIIATSLLTLVSSYYYLGKGATPVSAADAPPLGMGLWAAASALAAGAATRWLTHTVDHRDEPARRWPLLAAFVLFAVLAWLGFPVWSDTGLDAARGGYASAVLGLVGVALNASLVCYSGAFTWLVVVAVVHFWPRLAG